MFGGGVVFVGFFAAENQTYALWKYNASVSYYMKNIARYNYYLNKSKLFTCE